jgi:hypothetical protein
MTTDRVAELTERLIRCYQEALGVRRAIASEPVNDTDRQWREDVRAAIAELRGKA